jgi:nitronate monooxygenase
MAHKNTKDLLQLLGIEIPIIQAPMAGADTTELAINVSRAGGLGSLACAMLTADQVLEQYHAITAKTNKPINLNFFCHQQVEKSSVKQQNWLNRLLPYYAAYHIDPSTVAPAVVRMPFNEEYCRVVEQLRPPIVSFHFGLPDPPLLERVKATGAIILSSATTVEEGTWLAKAGCDVVIAQGQEAGGHRAIFLTDDLSTQLPTAQLVQLLAKELSVPIVASGGIADAQTIKQAFTWGAATVQLGTAYLFCAETRVAPLHRQVLASDSTTTITNIFSGRPARGINNRLIQEIGPICSDAPNFPYASDYIAPLRKASEAVGSINCMQLWSGQVRKPHTMGAYDFTRYLNGQL